MLHPAAATSGIAARFSTERCEDGVELCPLESRSSVTRRSLVVGGLAALIGPALPRLGHGAPIVLPASAGNRRFSVLYGRNKIGTHTVLFSSRDGETRVSTAVRLTVKGLFGSTAFSFSHLSEETWRAGRLISLKGETVEDGQTLRVDGAATSQGFRVVSKGGPFLAPAATLTSNSLWTPAVLEQVTVVDAHHGGVIGVSSRKFAEEQIAVAGRQLRATRHTFITPYVAGTIWYDNQDRWVRGAFELSGAKIEYQLDA